MVIYGRCSKKQSDPKRMYQARAHLDTRNDQLGHGSELDTRSLIDASEVMKIMNHLIVHLRRIRGSDFESMKIRGEKRKAERLRRCRELFEYGNEMPELSNLVGGIE